MNLKFRNGLRMSDLLARLVSLADCDGRAGEPLGKAMREAAAEIVRLMKERDAVRATALGEAVAECLDVADSYPDPHEGEIVAARALIRQSANVAKLCANRIRALAS